MFSFFKKKAPAKDDKVKKYKSAEDAKQAAIKEDKAAAAAAPKNSASASSAGSASSPTSGMTAEEEENKRLKQSRRISQTHFGTLSYNEYLKQQKEKDKAKLETTAEAGPSAST